MNHQISIPLVIEVTIKAGQMEEATGLPIVGQFSGMDVLKKGIEIARKTAPISKKPTSLGNSRNKTISAEQEAKCLEMYKAGLPLRDIEEALGWTRNRVGFVLYSKNKVVGNRKKM